MKSKRTRDIVAFCIMMQSGEGILEKHPNYIIRKFEGIGQGNLEKSLDKLNQAKFELWMRKYAGVRDTDDDAEGED